MPLGSSISSERSIMVSSFQIGTNGSDGFSINQNVEQCMVMLGIQQSGVF